MVERFFLDRVDAKAARAAVAEQLDTPCLRATYEAQASLPITQLAGARAHVALHPAVAERVPVARVNDRACRRSYYQALGRFAHAQLCSRSGGWILLQHAQRKRSSWHSSTRRSRSLLSAGAADAAHCARRVLGQGCQAARCSERRRRRASCARSDAQGLDC